MAEILNLDAICKEMLEILAKHKVSIGRMEGVLQHLKEMAHDSTPVQTNEDARVYNLRGT